MNYKHPLIVSLMLGAIFLGVLLWVGISRSQVKKNITLCFRFVVFFLFDKESFSCFIRGWYTKTGKCIRKVSLQEAQSRRRTLGSCGEEQIEISSSSETLCPDQGPVWGKWKRGSACTTMTTGVRRGPTRAALSDAKARRTSGCTATPPGWTPQGPSSWWRRAAGWTTSTAMTGWSTALWAYQRVAVVVVWPYTWRSRVWFHGMVKPKEKPFTSVRMSSFTSADSMSSLIWTFSDQSCRWYGRFQEVYLLLSGGRFDLCVGRWNKNAHFWSDCPFRGFIRRVL